MIMDIVDRLKKCMEGNVRTKHNALLACASDEIQTLRAQLPVGMQHCTIVFKRCEHGHGTLTATNWVQHECETCLINSLRAKVASAEVLVEALDMFVKDCTGEIIHSTNWMSQQGKKALATYNKLSEVKK